MCDKARFLVGVLCSVFRQGEVFRIPGIQGRVEEKFFRSFVSFLPGEKVK